MSNWFSSWFQGAEGGRAGGAPLSATEETVHALLALLRASVLPILEEARRIDSPSPEADDRLRRSLSDVLVELDQGLDEERIQQATAVFTLRLPPWFQERREAEHEQVAELSRVIAGMGSALKAIQGGDDEFYGSFASTIDEMRKTSSARDVRNASGRLLRLLDEATEKLSVQQRQNERRMASLAEMVHGLHKELDRAKVLLQEDPLTEVYNRGSFESHATSLLRKCRLAPFRWSLIMLDLDNFKTINDTFGHVGGDRLLQAAAKAMQGVVMRNSDFVARYGGEEFAVLLSDCDVGGAEVVAERLRLALESLSITSGSRPIQATASLGVAEACELDEVENVVRRADEALYLAKAAGRNRVVVAGRGAGATIALPGPLAQMYELADEEPRGAPTVGDPPRVVPSHGPAGRLTRPRAPQGSES